jgi:hypothetical protein
LGSTNFEFEANAFEVEANAFEVEANAENGKKYAPEEEDDIDV